MTALAVCLGLLPTSPALAASTMSGGAISLASFSHLVVGDTGGYVSGDDGIELHDFSGATAATITNLSGVQGLALSPDGKTLYAALKTGDALAVIDTATNAETSRIGLPSSSCPQELALVGTTLWFSYGCTGGRVGSVDLTVPEPTAALDVLTATSYTAPPLLASSPATAGRLLVADSAARDGSAVTTYDVTGATPSQLDSTALPALREMHLSADGTRLVVAPICCLGIKQLLVTDHLADSGASFPGGSGVALGPDNLLAVGGSGYSDTFGTNYLGNPNYLGNLTTVTAAGTLVKSLRFEGDSAYGLAGLTNGVAFDPSGTHLMMIATFHGARHAYVGTDMAREGITQTIQASTASPRINALFGIHERFFSTSTFPSSPVVHVSRVGPHDTVALPDQKPTPNGGFYFTDKVSVRGLYHYVLTFSGDDTHEDNATTLLMRVAGLSNGPIALTTAATKPYAYGSKPIVTAHLGATKNRVVSLYASPAGGTRVLLRRGVVDVNGNIGTRYTLTRNTTFQAVWDGDDTYNPTTSQRQLNTQVHISEIVYGASRRDGAYYVFNHTKNPVMRFGVTPDHTGDRISYFLDEYVNGKWVSAGGADGPSLAKGSQFYLGFGGTHKVGERARITFGYGGPRFAHPTNCPTAAAPVYIRFT